MSGPLNRPDFLNNFQSQVTVDQTVYDWGATRTQVRTAELGRTMSQEQERGTRMGLMASVDPNVLCGCPRECKSGCCS